MCRNTTVYDIDNNIVYNHRLLPGLMQKQVCAEIFNIWLKSRYSSNTNFAAQNLCRMGFNQNDRAFINQQTHIFSLSDSYWIKNTDVQLDFETVSPYYSDFWKGDGSYMLNEDISVPTLYTVGCLSKEWTSAKHLYKYGKNLDIEADVSLLCKACGIPVCNIDKINGGICVENFTNPSLMLEQADQSGLIDPDDFTEADIIKLFGIYGVQMITIDAIIGNGDRHAGNFGWLRNTATGDYVKPAPLYDFDHALDSTLQYDLLIKDTISAVQKNGHIDELLRICKIVTKLDTHIIFKIRANSMIKSLNTTIQR